MQINNYSDLSDEELIARYRAGESAIIDYLMEKYKNLVRKRANALFLLGGETEDLIQEGMIGLFKAVRDFDPEKSSFYGFAVLCVNRQLYHAVEAAARKKHTPLNSYVSLSAADSDTEDGAFEGDLPGASAQNPEQAVLEQEAVQALLCDLAKRLSPLESEVLGYYLEGLNYREIAKIMERSPKVIDNALQRIRAKVQETA